MGRTTSAPADCWVQQAGGAAGGTNPCLVCMVDLVCHMEGEGMEWNPEIQTTGDWKAAG